MSDHSKSNTSKPNMSTRELFENAHMDALGLLDEQDRVAFDVAFKAASPAIRAQIRAEQARMSKLESTLPRVNPPEVLRSRVLQAVEHAITEQSLRSDGGVSDFRTNRNISIWRAGAVAMACAAVIMGAAFVKVYVDNIQVNTNLTTDGTLTALLVGFGNGPMRDVLFDAKTNRAIFAVAESNGLDLPIGANQTAATALASTSQASLGDVITTQTSMRVVEAKAVLFHNPDWKSMRLFTQLPTLSQGQTYRVVILDDEGQVTQELAEFTSPGQVFSLELKTVIAAGTRVAIASVSRGERALVANVLLVATV